MNGLRRLFRAVFVSVVVSLYATAGQTILHGISVLAAVSVADAVSLLQLYDSCVAVFALLSSCHGRLAPGLLVLCCSV